SDEREKTHEISVDQLNDWIRSGKDFQLIDVREPYEYEIANLGGTLIPKGEILTHLDLLEREKPVVIHCRSGKRSQDVINLLSKEAGFHHLLNLQGGILAWADKIDSTMPKY
ncbi:MAG: rhodanese-like domain-containing protein, partial [Saprospiraceae bacterium]